ncbi:alpha/beta hydrolase [Legionella worsleiensis]|uniref:Putative hydrolase n=1 Tax=Legionella worsleiensis TaxID=45076 RepID=A0A0W1AFB1_9GAMM|nr:alpha/beta hydrolase [Legionella worsleiensis]KTD80017.1 putative hydrolase [Legionella worsleiensis]STY32489.1 putative hydrolase [Legionella worsleiensis]
MMTNSLTQIRDFLHAQLCYQLFITPLHFPLDKQYRDFARMACEYIEIKRSEAIHQDTPRHHVIHRFAPAKNANGKKVLIAHGWMSRAAYMVRLIRYLHLNGYEVYALDFPAHGEAKGIQLPWTDAVTVLKETINQHGPFHGLIGHSFGGSMLLSTLNLAGQFPQWQLHTKPERVILIASPTQMRSPVNTIARRMKLTGHGYLQLRHLIHQQADIDPKLIRLKYFTSQAADIPFLCIHGKNDITVKPKESIIFCKEYKKANLALLPDADHVSVLMDERVEQLVGEFLTNSIEPQFGYKEIHPQIKP